MDMQAFLWEVNKLKGLTRTGWAVEKIARPETVAEHSFGTALLALLLAKDVDRDKAVQMALVHDLAECIVGDILVDWKVSDFHKKALGGNHGITQAEKKDLERRAMATLTDGLEGGERLLALWNEVEDGKTKEAAFVRDLDKLDMLIQALIYEQTREVNLDHWLREARNQPKDPRLLAFYQRLLADRNKNQQATR
ncbi:MAG: HD domain-containing protein [Candidatus Aenigmarchaeota archaeon]|nr:HD domain-containing protein [Candidatus Aenigmarchaeota archaeon]